MNVIILAAGKSSRFPNMRPKYLLTCYDHKLMIEHAIECFDELDNITIVILKEHCEQYQADVFLREALGDKIHIVILDHITNGPAETAMLAIKEQNITGPIFIKDCDTFLQFTPESGNRIAVANLKDYPTIKNVGGKSFVKSNEQGIIQSIVEKQVVSNIFSVGGYQFNSATMFVDQAAKLINTSNQEVYISHVIDSLIADGEVFSTLPVASFVDVGTANDWLAWNRQRPVLFIDIDGVLVRNQSRYGSNKFGTPVDILEKNVAVLLTQQAAGAQFIFTTGRQSSFDDITHQLLQSLGFKNYQLLSGLYTTNRILVNDFDYSNPYPSATAINVVRNGDDLEKYFKGL